MAVKYPYPYRGEISIEQVLSDIRKPGAVFWLAFCRSSGKQRGTMKVVSRCKYGAPPIPAPPGGIGVRPSQLPDRKIALHVEKGTLPCHSADTGEYLTPLISHMEGFNLRKIIHSNGKPD